MDIMSLAYLQAQRIVPMPEVQATPMKPLILQAPDEPSTQEQEQGKKRKRGLTELSSSKRNIIYATPVKSSFSQQLILKQTEVSKCVLIFLP